MIFTNSPGYSLSEKDIERSWSLNKLLSVDILKIRKNMLFKEWNIINE